MIKTKWFRHVIYESKRSRNTIYLSNSFPRYFIQKFSIMTNSGWRGHEYDVIFNLGTGFKNFGTFYRLVYAKSYVEELYISEGLK